MPLVFVWTYYQPNAIIEHMHKSVADGSNGFSQHDYDTSKHRVSLALATFVMFYMVIGIALLVLLFVLPMKAFF
jgi:type IV secretory pathway component VirB8